MNKLYTESDQRSIFPHSASLSGHLPNSLWIQWRTLHCTTSSYCIYMIVSALVKAERNCVTIMIISSSRSTDCPLLLNAHRSNTLMGIDLQKHLTI